MTREEEDWFVIRVSDVPVWRSGGGKVYDTWDDLGLEHLDSVVQLLKKQVEKAQYKYNRAVSVKLPWYTQAGLERVWTKQLLRLESAKSALEKRVNGKESWDILISQRPKQVRNIVNKTGELPRRIRLGNRQQSE